MSIKFAKQLNEQHHRYACVVIFENSPSQKARQSFPLYGTTLLVVQILHAHGSLLLYLINEIGNEKYEGEHTGDECTYPDVGGLATGPLLDDSCCRWTPVPVSTLHNAGEKVVQYVDWEY